MEKKNIKKTIDEIFYSNINNFNMYWWIFFSILILILLIFLLKKEINKT